MPADWDDHVSEMRNLMEQAFQTVRDQFGQAFQRAKQTYDGRVKKLQFKADDLVWFFCPRKRPRLGPKWQLLTSGPWRIEKVLNSVNYMIRRVGRRDRRVVHVDRLQRYDDAAQDGVVLASRPGSEGDSLARQPRPNGVVLTSQPSDTFREKSGQRAQWLISRRNQRDLFCYWRDGLQGHFIID